MVALLVFALLLDFPPCCSAEADFQTCARNFNEKEFFHGSSSLPLPVIVMIFACYLRQQYFYRDIAYLENYYLEKVSSPTAISQFIR